MWPTQSLVSRLCICRSVSYCKTTRLVPAAFRPRLLFSTSSPANLAEKIVNHKAKLGSRAKAAHVFSRRFPFDTKLYEKAQDWPQA